VTLSDPLPAGTTFVSLASPAGWTCTTPAVGAAGTVSCSLASLAPASPQTFTLTANVGVAYPAGTPLSNTASVASTSSDPNTGNQSATVTATVLSPAVVTATKTVQPAAAVMGSTVTYTIVLTNSGSSPQQDNPGDEFTDVLPSALTLVSASATSGTTTTAGNTVHWNGSIAAGGTVTITIKATIGAATVGVVIDNQGTVQYDADGNGTNESQGLTDDPSRPGVADATSLIPLSNQIPTLGELGRLILLGMLGGMGMHTARTRRGLGP
jgi:uncharacterized repeat protein (TIGR01451 family)